MDLVIMAAVAVDLLIGDPRWLPHPVVGMGWVIKQGEIFIRRRARTKLALKWSGAVLTALVVAGSYFFFWGLINLAGAIHPVAGLLVGIFFMSQALAVKGLYQHARAVVQPLARNDLPAARQALGRIVGRDTADLDEQEVIRGTVESVAENTVDGIAAPLFYGFLGGPPLALAYKAVNTLDSMIGYRDERYIDLGWAAARLDDLVNYLPARISGLIFLLIAPLTPGGFINVCLTIHHDARRHPSPNSGIPEAAVAGALGIQLGGTNYYQGIPSHRAKMGKFTRPLSVKDINSTLILMAAMTGLMLVLGTLASFAIMN